VHETVQPNPSSTSNTKDSVLKLDSGARNDSAPGLVPVQESLEPKVPPGSEALGAGEKSSSKATDSLEKEQQKTPREPDISRKIWDKAYSIIEAKEKDLANTYLAVLRESLAPDIENGAHKKKKKEITLLEAAKISEELNNKTEGPERLKDLVKKGAQKAEEQSKIADTVGFLAQGILKADPLVKVLTQLPHLAPAALPWAGICIGLQVSNGSSASLTSTDL
jgi:N-terminal domain of NWD NACHT-NTPase